MAYSASVLAEIGPVGRGVQRNIDAILLTGALAGLMGRV